MNELSAPVAATDDCAVVELRQYTLKPERRDELIVLFDRQFVETQEACGMRLIGQFRDLDDPDRFVWLRGFPGMPARARALAAFYGGPVWQAHREAANATMIDSDDVLLLRPAHAGSGFANDDTLRPPPAATGIASDIFVATVYAFDAPVGKDFIAFFDAHVAVAAREAGAGIVASLVTEAAANDFPRLPVREGEHVFVWLARFDDLEAHRNYEAVLEQSPRWQEIAAMLRQRVRNVQRLRLSPTARSRLPATAWAARP